jgi:hypothetical protein
MCWTSPKGMIARPATAVMIAIIGAMRKSTPTEVVGRSASLVANLTISATGWSNPKGPTRLGP